LLGSTSSSAATKQVAVRRSTDETYRHYRLIAGQRGDGFSAVAYAGKFRVFTGSGSDLDGALDDLKTQIDRDFALRAGQRKGGLPSSEELQLALPLASRAMTSPIMHLLEALRDGPAVSPKQMQRTSGAEEETLLRDLVRLARTVATILALPLPKGNGNATAALDLLAERIAPNREASAVWVFRPAFVAAALAHLAR